MSNPLVGGDTLISSRKWSYVYFNIYSLVCLRIKIYNFGINTIDGYKQEEFDKYSQEANVS